MAIDLPSRARVVIVGGGVIGCSVAYHLGKLGWSDVVLLERKQLTSGTTWHAAGLIGQLRQSINMTKLARYTAELYRGLEAETGQATGYRQCGSDLARDHRATAWRSSKRNASMAKTFGLPVHVVSPAEIRSLYPLVESRRCDRRHPHPERRLRQCRRHHPGARQGRAVPRRAGSSRTSRSTSIRHDGRRVTGVETDAGPHRGRLRRALRRHVDARSGREHRRDRAAACLRALLRAVPGRAGPRPEPAGAARLRSLQLLQVRRRQAPGRRLRAERAPLGHGRHPGGFLVRRDLGRLQPLRAGAPRCACAAFPPSSRRASRSSSAARRASRRTCAITWARRPSSRIASSPPA